MLNELLKVLGWQGGTIHQIVEVLEAAKFVVKTHKECCFDGEWDKMPKAIVNLEKTLNN